MRVLIRANWLSSSASVSSSANEQVTVRSRFLAHSAANEGTLDELLLFVTNVYSLYSWDGNTYLSRHIWPLTEWAATQHHMEMSTHRTGNLIF